MKSVLAAALLLASGTVCADDLLVQSRQSFLKHWKQAGPGLEHLEVGGRRQPLYGCINVGIVVEADGSVSGPARLLLYRFDRVLPPGPNMLVRLTELAPQVLPKFVPLDANTTPVATFTSWPIALRSDKLEKKLRGRDASGLDAALMEGCAVDDVLERMQDKNAKPEERPPLPGLDELAPLLSEKRG